MLLIAAIALFPSLIVSQGNSCTNSGTLCSTTGSSMSNSVTNGATYRTITSTGCPNYDYSTQTTPCLPRTHSNSWTVPRYPQVSTTKIYVGIKTETGATVTSTIKGAIGNLFKILFWSLGMAVNGVVLYGNANAEDQDAFISEGYTFDVVGGHADVSNT